MEESIKNKIIKDYKKGISSIKLSKKYGWSKPKILKILNDQNLVRKRNRCDQLNIDLKNGIFSIGKKCPICGSISLVTSKQKTVCCRNYFNLKNKNCKKCSLELQKGEGNPFYGKKHKKETLKKISVSRKGKGVGINNSMANPIWRNKSSNNLKKRWGEGFLENTRKVLSDNMKQRIRKGKIKFKNFSKKEIEIIKQIQKSGYKTKHLFKVDTKICDIYVPELNLIIEFFGDYWHCNPKKYSQDYYNQKKSLTAKEIWEYDSKRIDLIKSYGYNLEVIWESDLKNDIKLINQTIEKYVKSK